jgi:hypothetical protein
MNNLLEHNSLLRAASPVIVEPERGLKLKSLFLCDMRVRLT